MDRGHVIQAGLETDQIRPGARLQAKHVPGRGDATGVARPRSRRTLFWFHQAHIGDNNKTIKKFPHPPALTPSLW